MAENDPSEAEVNRWLASVEATLRQRGFSERTIQKHRATNRAQLIAHLRSQSGRA